MPLNADDIAAITNLAHAYNQAVDRHDPDAWTATFTDDAELRSPFGNPTGHDELRQWVGGVISGLSGTRHCTLNEVIDGEGDRATMRSSYFVVGTNEAPPTIGATGGYDDELIRLDGAWRFTKRVHTVDASFGGDSLSG